jgi:hypothetical protein
MSPQNQAIDTPAASYADAAQAFLEKLRALRQEIPNLTFPLSAAEARRLNSAASVPDDFIEMASVAMKNSPQLVAAVSADPDQMRDLVRFSNAYVAIAQELDAMGFGSRHTVAIARHKAGSDALDVYAAAKTLARRADGAHLRPHIAEMRRTLGRGRTGSARSRSKGKQPAPPAPAEQAVTSAESAPSPAKTSSNK